MKLATYKLFMVRDAATGLYLRGCLKYQMWAKPGQLGKVWKRRSTLANDLKDGKKLNIPMITWEVIEYHLVESTEGRYPAHALTS